MSVERTWRRNVAQRGLLLLAALIGLALFPLAPAARAAGPNCTVAANGGTYTSLQAAINDSGCSTIDVAAGTYVENVSIGRSVTINGATSGGTIIDGSAGGNVFTITGASWPIPFVTLNRLTIQNGGGNGVYINGPGLEVRNSTIRNNHDAGLSSFISNISVVNSTIVDNTAGIGVGGGIQISYASATITASTIAGNSISRSGQYGVGELLMAGDGTITLRNTIVARGCATRYNGAFVDGGHNLDGAGGCNVAGGNPRLDPNGLQNNGGPTPTIALLAGSPAIDAGDDALCASTSAGIDQRGVSRPQGAHCDIGAYELQPTVAPLVAVNFMPNGQNGWFSSNPASGSVTAQGQASITSINCTGATVSNLQGIGTANASATLTVAQEGTTAVTCSASDSAGDSGAAPGSQASASVMIDSLAPETTISAAPTGVVNAPTATIAFGGSDAGASGLASYQCALDGGAFSACTSPQSYSGLTDGNHTVQVRASDAAGNIDASPASATWTIESDVTPPAALPSQSPAANAAGWNNSPVTVTWNWSDNAGGKGIDASACTSSSTSSGEGTLALSASCADVVGNQASASYSVKVDTTAPTTSGSASPNGAQATVTLTASDSLSGLAAMQYSVNSGAAQPYSAPFVLSGAGTYVVTFASTDLAGNLETTQTLNVTIAQPANVVLDDFDRANGVVGAKWDGLTSSAFYRILSKRLAVVFGGPLVWKRTTFGASQEAFVTLSTIDTKSPSQGVLLKVQTGSIPNAGAISVVYDALARVVRVSTLRLSSNGAWTIYAGKPASFANGDVLRARALASGEVQIFKNDTLLATVTLSATDKKFFNAKGGKIGIWTAGATRAALDDFGGGDVEP